MSTITTFGAFNAARLGIYVSSRAMDVVGNNISNINTEGYTRQKVDQSSLYLGGSDRYVSRMDQRIGQGAVISKVSQYRDPYLDIRYRNETTNVGAMDQKQYYLEQLSGILDEVAMGTDGEGIIEAQFNDLISQMEALAAPDGAGKDNYDTLVRESAKALCQKFNKKANDLQDLLERETKNFKEITLPKVNRILTNIQDLSESIRKIDLHGGSALELRDRRNLLLDELSEYMKIDVTYEQEDLGDGLSVEKMKVTTATEPKRELIDGIYVTQLSIRQVPGVDENGKPISMDSPTLDLDLAPLTDPKGKERVKTVLNPKSGTLDVGDDYKTIRPTIEPTELPTMSMTEPEKVQRPTEPKEVKEPKAPEVPDDPNDPKYLKKLEKYQEKLKNYNDYLTKKAQYDKDKEAYDAYKEERKKYNEALDQYEKEMKAYKKADNQAWDDAWEATKERCETAFQDFKKNTDEPATTEDGKALFNYAYEKRVSYVMDKDGNRSLQYTFIQSSQYKSGGGVVELGDNELYGRLQSDRDMLTEKGEYATKADEAIDPQAAIKRGIPYYQKALDTLAAEFAKVMNEANTIPDEELYYSRKDGDDLIFTDAQGNDLAAGAEPVLREEYKTYNGGTLFSNSSNNSDPEGITAANISISDDWARSLTRMLKTKEPGNKNSTENDNLKDILAELLSDQEFRCNTDRPDVDPFFVGSFQEMLTENMSGTLAMDRSTTKKMLDNYGLMQDELFTDRDSVTGVDLNDEAMNMMQLQKSYSAACRLMTSVDEMLDKLINGTGVAGR